jgi:cytochrome P450
LSDDDLGSHLREIVIGGAETNPRSLAATVRRLADAPDQRAEVAGDPTLAAAAFLEGVRIDTPGQFIGRTLGRGVELHGRTLSRGDVALLLIASANRDEREFTAPDDYDIHRTPRRSLGFGHGAHFCVGRHVAVLESQIAIQQLLAIAPEFVVDAARSTRSHHEMVHGYTSLPVRAA